MVAYDALLAVERHVMEAFDSSQSSLSPIDIVTNLTKMGPHFAVGVQQGAHEFLRSLTADMHLADLRVGGSPHPHTQQHTNMLDVIFSGLLRSQVRCGLCLTDSVRYDTFLDLSLEVHRSVFVSEALRSFTDIDVLEGDNKYECMVCKTKTCVTKRLTLHSTSRVLQLHLKMFRIFEEGGSAKIGHHVTFPELLNVQPFTSPEGQHSENSLDFALYAVVVHVGASIRRGHYVAYVKDARGEWFQMDDHKTSPVSLSEVLQVQVYMLFYIQTVHRNAGIDSVIQQTEQVSDSMDEDRTLVTDETLSLPDSKTLTRPEQVARYSAPTVAEPAEELLMSHAIAVEPPAVSGWKTPVPGEPPTKVENSVSILGHVWRADQFPAQNGDSLKNVRTRFDSLDDRTHGCRMIP